MCHVGLRLCAECFAAPLRMQKHLTLPQWRKEGCLPLQARHFSAAHVDEHRPRLSGECYLSPGQRPKTFVYLKSTSHFGPF